MVEKYLTGFRGQNGAISAALHFVRHRMKMKHSLFPLGHKVYLARFNYGTNVVKISQKLLCLCQTCL